MDNYPYKMKIRNRSLKIFPNSLRLTIRKRFLFSLKPKNYHLQPTRNGQVLVEAMVALSALTLGYLAILALLNQSLGTSATVSDRNIATYLSAEGIEIVRNLSDAAVKNGDFGENFQPQNNRRYEVSWDTLLESDSDSDNFNPGLWLQNNDPSPLRYDSQLGYNYQSGTATRFTRVLYVFVDRAAPADPLYLKVKSVVSWTGKGGLTDNVVMEDFFFNWK